MNRGITWKAFSPVTSVRWLKRLKQPHQLRNLLRGSNRSVRIIFASAMAEHSKNESQLIDKLFAAGAHFGLIRSRRHPSVKPFLFGIKNRVEIFDLVKTSEALLTAKNFVKQIGASGGILLFVGGKTEAKDAIRGGTGSISMPYVAGRWLGGTLTNFAEIRKRIAKLVELTAQRERGELAKYTKKERVLIDREIDRLQEFFSGLVTLTALPKALFVVDPRREINAVREARHLKIPIVALASSDCNVHEVDYPVPGNDASKASIEFVVSEIVSAFAEGRKAAPAAAAAESGASEAGEVTLRR
ncbi:30S ribosomal protein S2 [Patescibacteria group bacterium]|nr:MAG: 30S ribosomal protein S2 [Patescibacteria group bacterium]